MGSNNNANDVLITSKEISNDVSNFSGALEQWKKTNDAINGAQKAVNIMDKAVKTEEAMTEVSTALSQISKISAGFGMAGAAIGLASIFLPSSDPSAETLKQLSKIEAQISNLQDVLVQKMDTLGVQIESMFHDFSLNEHITDLESILLNIKNYKNAVLNKMDLSPYKNMFIESQLSDLSKFAVSIKKDEVDADKVGTGKSYFDDIYELTYGDANKIRDIGFQLINYLLCARSAYVFVQSYLLVQKNKDNEGKVRLNKKQLDSIEDIAFNTFDVVAINPLRDAIKKYLIKCQTEEKNNITRYLDDQSLTLKRSQSDTNKLAFGLSEKWPTYSWFVICYEDVKGWNNHGYVTKGLTSYSHHIWRVNGNNIVVNGAKLVSDSGEKIVPGPVPKGLKELFLFVEYGDHFDYQMFRDRFVGKPKLFVDILKVEWRDIGFNVKDTDYPPSAEKLLNILQSGPIQFQLCWYLRRGKNVYFSEPQPTGLQPPYTRGHDKGFTFMYRT